MKKFLLYSVALLTSATMITSCLGDLDAEPLVLGNLRSVAPFAGNLEDAVMLTPDDVLEKMRYLLTGVL